MVYDLLTTKSFIVLKLVVEKLFLKPVKNRESPLQKESYM
jgi:hypothetical protein